MAFGKRPAVIRQKNRKPNGRSYRSSSRRKHILISPSRNSGRRWYPLGHGDRSLIKEPVFAKLGQKYGKTPAQVILRWHTQMGFAVIPGSKNVEHIKDNLDILDFTLSEEEMAEIAKLDKGVRYYHRTDEQLVQFAGWRPAFEEK